MHKSIQANGGGDRNRTDEQFTLTLDPFASRMAIMLAASDRILDRSNARLSALLSAYQ